MTEHCSDDDQTVELTQQEQVFLDRVGIVVIRAKQIAAYMGVSAEVEEAALPGREEYRLSFPAGGERGFTYTHLSMQVRPRIAQYAFYQSNGKTGT